MTYWHSNYRGLVRVKGSSLYLCDHLFLLSWYGGDFILCRCYGLRSFVRLVDPNVSNDHSYILHETLYVLVKELFNLYMNGTLSL